MTALEGIMVMTCFLVEAVMTPFGVVAERTQLMVVRGTIAQTFSE
jgi:hypothetical protein